MDYNERLSVRNCIGTSQIQGQVELMNGWTRVCRDGENRTHIGGFGDHCPTVERRPYNSIGIIRKLGVACN